MDSHRCRPSWWWALLCRGCSCGYWPVSRFLSGWNWHRSEWLSTCSNISSRLSQGYHRLWRILDPPRNTGVIHLTLLIALWKLFRWGTFAFDKFCDLFPLPHSANTQQRLKTIMNIFAEALALSDFHSLNYGGTEYDMSSWQNMMNPREKFVFKDKEAKLFIFGRNLDNSIAIIEQ